MIFMYISAAGSLGRRSEGLLNRMVESKIKLRIASPKPRKSQRVNMEMRQTRTRDPIRPTRMLIPETVPFHAWLNRSCEIKNHAEIVSVTTVRVSSPSEELNPRKNGEAYKFGLKSHSPMRVEGTCNSLQTNRTNHTERINAVVLIQGT